MTVRKYYNLIMLWRLTAIQRLPIDLTDNRRIAARSINTIGYALSFCCAVEAVSELSLSRLYLTSILYNVYVRLVFIKNIMNI